MAEIREKPAAIVAIGLGLVTILVAATSLLRGDVVEVDGRARLEERFEVQGDLPFGFAVTQALRLAGGEVLVMLSDPAGPAPAPEPDLPKVEIDPPRTDGGGRGDEWTDWTRVEVGPAGTQPVEVAFVWYPRPVAEGILEALFAHVRFQDFAHVGHEDRTVLPVDSGHLDWGAYEAGYVRLRHLSKEGERPVFHDSLRVNLTLGSDCCVVYMRWPQGLPGSVERAKEVLAVFQPRS